MVISYLHIMSITVFPSKTDPPLIVNGYGILSATVSFQGVQTVTGRNLQVIEADGQFDEFKAANRPGYDIRRQSL
jgi:hypothetical protein